VYTFCNATIATHVKTCSERNVSVLVLLVSTTFSQIGLQEMSEKYEGISLRHRFFMMVDTMSFETFKILVPVDWKTKEEE